MNIECTKNDEFNNGSGINEITNKSVILKRIVQLFN